ncbi:hypothetical protein BGW38_005766, partial [Lunasporangiospora selenospora]
YEGTLSDVAMMVERLFSRYLNRIPRTGHKNLQIWRAQISDALAHEKGQPRPRFESFGVKRGRQWVYRLTEFGRGMVEAMGGVDRICEELLKHNQQQELTNVEGGGDGGAAGGGGAGSVMGQDQATRDADGVPGNALLGSQPNADAGIGQGQGYGYSYRPPDARQKSKKTCSRRRRSKKATTMAAAAAGLLTEMDINEKEDPTKNAIAIAMEAMAAGFAAMTAIEDEKAAARRNAGSPSGGAGGGAPMGVADVEMC